MPYTPILATLGYIFSQDGRTVLLVHRNKRVDDPHFGKYNGLGGKLQAGEDVVACMRREIREEADLECLQISLCGTISWPGFGKQGEDWFGFLFRIDAWSGTPLSENAEGTLAWVPVDRVLTLPLWEGDRHFLPLVFDRSEQQFHGVMPYQDRKPVSWSYSTLGKGQKSDIGGTIIAEARRLLARGEFDMVIDQLDVHRPAEWTVVDQKEARILRILGQAYVRRGDWRSGRDCLEQLRSAQCEQTLLPPLLFAGALTDLLTCQMKLGMEEMANEVRKEAQGLATGER